MWRERRPCSETRSTCWRTTHRGEQKSPRKPLWGDVGREPGCVAKRKNTASIINLFFLPMPPARRMMYLVRLTLAMSRDQISLAPRWFCWKQVLPEVQRSGRKSNASQITGRLWGSPDAVSVVNTEYPQPQEPLLIRSSLSAGIHDQPGSAS